MLVGKSQWDRGTLELVKGRELESETTYVIVGKVFDAAGNELRLRMSPEVKSKLKAISTIRTLELLTYAGALC